MPKNSILILLGVVEIIVLTLVGLYFFGLSQEDVEGSFYREEGPPSSAPGAYLV